MQEGKIDEKIVSVEEMFSNYPAFFAQPHFDKMLQNGNPIPYKDQSLGERVRMYTSSGVFIGIYEWNTSRQQYKPLTIFCTPQDFQ